MNNEIGEKYLPIGTVVMLKGGTKRAMITGFCSIAKEESNKVYDYSGCIYPEGYISSNQVCLFDHNQIEKVYHTGLIDEEEISFKGKLKTLIEQMQTNHNSSDINNSASVEPVMPNASETSELDPMAQPVMDVPVAPEVDPTTQPVMDIPVAPVVDPTTQPAMDVPVVPVVDPMAQPVMDVPVAPVVDPTTQPAMDVPVAPELDPMAQPVMDVPVAPVVNPMAQPVMDVPVAPVVDPMTQPVMDVPVAPEGTDTLI